ncbi:hypothetical protein ACWXVO_01950 [Mycoplasma sp. 1890]
MKKSVIIAYKFEVSSFSVEVIEQNSFGNILIYKRSISSTIFNLFELDSFICKTKKEIEATISLTIKNVVVIIQDSPFLKINKKIISNKSNQKLTNYELAKKLYYLEKSNSNYLFDYSYLNNDNNNRLISLNLLEWNVAKNIFNLFKKNNLNILKIYDYEFLKNIYFNQQRDSGIATQIYLDDYSLKLDVLKNDVVIIKKNVNLGIDYLIEFIAKQLKTTKKIAYTKFNLWQCNLNSGNNLLFKKVLGYYLKKINDYVESFLKNIKDINIKVNFNVSNSKFLETIKTFKNFKILSYLSDKAYCAIDVISYEMMGIINLVNKRQNTIKEMTITSELFILDVNKREEKGYSFNYKK